MKASIKNSKRRRKIQKGKKYVFFFFIWVACISSAAFVYYLLGSRISYVSPLPFLKAVATGGSVNAEDTKQTIERELKKREIAYVSIDTTNSERYSIFLAEKREVLLAPQKDIASQIASLQVILIRLTMEGKQFSKLDLRFEKPVMVF